ncbi:MAG: hypothetical protein HY722_10100 [Planctomycetes bacterium]|nr:hypothetical protein [Planctomycetota bacterium]
MRTRALALALAALSLPLGAQEVQGPPRGPPGGPPGAPPRSPTGETAPLSAEAVAAARARGVAFLVVHQTADGSWGSFESRRTGEIYLGTVASHRAFQQATSALACLALAGPAREGGAVDEAFQRGLDRLLEESPVPRADGGTLYDNWAHCYRLQALALLLAEPRLAARVETLRAAARRELEVLVRQQAADGGWGYYDFGYALQHPSGHESTSFLTAAVLVALADLSAALVEAPGHVVEAGLASLERLRLGNGAYVYGNYALRTPEVLYNRPEGSLGRSQPCNYALWRHGRATEADLRLGLDRLFERHAFLDIGRTRPYPHEAWYYTAGYYYYFGHYYAGRAVGAVGEAGRAEYRRALERAIVPHQDPQGAWWDFPFYGYHRAYGTALALLALEAAGGR